MAEDSAPVPPPSAPSAARPYLTPEGPPRRRGDGRGYILALACLQAVGGIVYFAINSRRGSQVNAEVVLGVMLALSAIFFGLWIWAKKAPFAALLTTLIVFVTFHLLDAVIDPISLVQGIVIKIVILAGLVTALKKAYIAKRERELEAMEK